MRISDWSSDVCSSDLLPHIPGNAVRTNQNYATLLRLRIASLSDSPTPFVPNSERGVQARHQRHPVVLSIIGRRGPLGSAVAVLLDVLSSIGILPETS